MNSREKLEAFLLQSMENGLVTDGVLAQDLNQASSFWHIREVLSYLRCIPEIFLFGLLLTSYALSP